MIVSKHAEQFRGCSVYLTQQTDQPKPTVFPKCWTSRNNGVNVILKYGKGGGRGGRTSLSQLEFYFDAICLLFISMFLSFSFCLLGCSFPSSSPLKGTTLVRMECRITCLFVCWRSYVQRRSFLRSFLRPRRETFKGHCSRPTPLSFGDNKKQQKKVEEEEGKKTVLQ